MTVLLKYISIDHGLLILIRMYRSGGGSISSGISHCLMGDNSRYIIEMAQNNYFSELNSHEDVIIYIKKIITLLHGETLRNNSLQRDNILLIFFFSEDTVKKMSLTSKTKVTQIYYLTAALFFTFSVE